MCLLYCSGLDEIQPGTQYDEMVTTIHDQVSRLHMLTLTHLPYDQPERDQFEKVDFILLVEYTAITYHST